jgi:hypothetical protein
MPFVWRVVARSRSQARVRLPQPSRLTVFPILTQPSERHHNAVARFDSGVPTAKQRLFALDNDASEGLYLVHASTKDAVGKGAFLLGRLVTDFFIASYVDTANPVADVQAYLKDFHSVGGS